MMGELAIECQHLEVDLEVLAPTARHFLVSPWQHSKAENLET